MAKANSNIQIFKEESIAYTKSKGGPAYVYTITLIADGRSYVGITARPYKTRWREHRNSINKPDIKNLHIVNALRLYGPDAFYWQLLSVCETWEDACNAERGVSRCGLG